MTYSAKDDSADTVREIISLNDARAKVCPTDGARLMLPQDHEVLSVAPQAIVEPLHYYYCGIHDCSIAPDPRFPSIRNSYDTLEPR